ncbi:MAG TPA: hypothetical protein ENH01_03020 [Nitrospirae bacterium]|nr:hypothetical protein [Nitrospirota bacterium]
MPANEDRAMMNTKRKGKHGQSYLSFLLLCLLMLFTSACSSGMKQYVRPGADFRAIKAVAVLPLENFSSDKYANGKLRSKIIIELLSRGIDVIEPGEVVTALRYLKVRSIDSIRTEDIRAMGKMLNVNAVIKGSVEAFGISKGITVSYPEVSIHLTLIETATGNTVWSVWHTTGGASFWTRHFGAEGRTLDNASADVVREAFDAIY